MRQSLDERAGVLDVQLRRRSPADRRIGERVVSTTTTSMPATSTPVSASEDALGPKLGQPSRLVRITAAPAARRTLGRCLRRARAGSAAGSSGRRAASGARRTRHRARSALPTAASRGRGPAPSRSAPAARRAAGAGARVRLDLVAQRRTRPDQAHLAAEDVPELRQLVDRGAAQDPPDARDAAVPGVDGVAGALASRRRRPSCGASAARSPGRPCRPASAERGPGRRPRA